MRRRGLIWVLAVAGACGGAGDAFLDEGGLDAMPEDGLAQAQGGGQDAGLPAAGGAPGFGGVPALPDAGGAMGGMGGIAPLPMGGAPAAGGMAGTGGAPVSVVCQHQIPACPDMRSAAAWSTGFDGRGVAAYRTKTFDSTKYLCSSCKLNGGGEYTGAPCWVWRPLDNGWESNPLRVCGLGINECENDLACVVDGCAQPSGCKPAQK